MGLSISQNFVPQPPIFVEEQAILVEDVVEQQEAFMPEEFEAIRLMARDGLEKAIGDDTVGLKKALSEKVESAVQEYVPTLTAAVKNCILQTTPTFGPIINVGIDTCIEPAAKKIAKFSTEKCIDKAAKPALNSCVDTSTKVTQKCAQKTVNSTQTMWSWAVSFIK